MKTQPWKTGVTTALFSIPALLLSLGAAAHEPEKHAKNAQGPDCAAMKDMDHEKMDKDDPIMQAMMEQCMSHMKSMEHDHDAESSADADHPGHGGERDSKPSQHEH